MGKISLDLSSLKAAGIYTLEIDNSQRTETDVNPLRLIVGFSNKGPFNRPVYLENEQDRLALFGDIDTKLEQKGCFFNRMTKTLLQTGPVVALNLLNTDNRYAGPDQVNYAALSVDAGKANPVVLESIGKYGQYDYLAETTDNKIYNTTKGDNVPYIGTTPYSSLYNRSRFWTPDKDLLSAAAARGLNTNDWTMSSGTFEYTNLLNFANVGTEEFSILVFKPANVGGYDVTAESWYGGRENIPFGWIRPYDYISDYFLQVVCVKGNWSNYAVLSTDPMWMNYFDKNGIIKDKINAFISAEGITVLGSWSGIIIPDFIDKQGVNLTLEKKINAATERTGLLMSFNNDAANVLNYDYTGQDAAEDDPNIGCWGIDIDGNNELENGESEAPYIVDMVGHGAFNHTNEDTTSWVEIDLDVSCGDESFIEKGRHVTGSTTTVNNAAPANMILLLSSDDNITINSIHDSTTYTHKPGVYVDQLVMQQFDASAGPVNLDSNNSTLLSYITPNYYIISKTGRIATKRITQSSVTFNYIEPNLDAIVGDNTIPVNVDVTLYYNDVFANIGFTMNINKQHQITDIYNISLSKAVVQTTDAQVNGINFLSYNYIENENDGVSVTVPNVFYFADKTLWPSGAPIDEDVKNQFIITNPESWVDSQIKVGDLVQNITYYNNVGETSEYKIIPGLTRVIKKRFIKVYTDGDNKKYILYNGKQYYYNGEANLATNGNYGFYLLDTTTAVLITDNTIVRQLPISDDAISHSLRFIPLKGLQLSSRHRPGYDTEGNLNIEDGIEKIYNVLEDEGIKRGLMNPQMVDYRYIVDSMSYGLRAELGGKVHLSRIAAQRMKCLAILNLPSAKQFQLSSEPYFCNTFIPGTETRPALNTKYIAAGGNTEMGTEAVFSLPTQDNGSQFTACFFPHLIYTENGKSVAVPPAADVCNVLNRKFTGVNDPYCICANMNGILSNSSMTNLEFFADLQDRESLEPFGVNTIIKENNQIMIYGNQTAYQEIKSDLNKLHIRENLNTAEIECEAILKKFNFLYNNAATRAAIVAQLTPVLQVMQTSGALSKYEIICDESNNTAEVIEADAGIVDIGLWFNHGLEKIVQRFTVNRYNSID